MSRSGNSSRKHPARTASTSLHSAGEALSTVTARGRPSPEATATILVPLPRLVGPTAKPPFWRSRTSHPRTLPPDSACLVHAGGEQASATLRPTCLREPTAGSGDGRFDREDTCRAFPTTVRRCQVSRTRRAAPRVYRARDGHGYPRDAPDARLVPPTPIVRLSVPNGRPCLSAETP
jgi:hypothetical protein